MRKCSKFTDLAGPEVLRSKLATLVREARTQTVVLSGPAGSGKKTWAGALAAAWLCSAPTQAGACGVCPACHYYAAETHPDYIELLPEAAGKSVPIDQIRKRVHAEVDLRPQIGQRRVWVLDGDGLLESGQNALLKVLEEPPPHAHFILVVSDIGSLLPTLVSRAVNVSLPRLRADELEQVLEKAGVADREARKLAITFARGLPGVALELAGGDTYPELRMLLLDWLRAFPTHGLAEALTEDYTFFESHRAELATVFMFLQSLVRDLAVLQSSKVVNLLMHPDLSADLQAMNKRNPLLPAQASRVIHILNEAEYRLQGNANFEMTICRMLLLIREEYINARSNRRSLSR